MEQAASAFLLDGRPVSCQPIGHGHINETLKICTDTGHQYVLQRINKYVFKDPVKVMENVCAVTDFLYSKSHDPNTALRFLPTAQGAYYHLDDRGEYWRMYDFVDGFSLEAPESDADFYESALAFGRFQELLAGFPAHTLHETIPQFHNTVDRYRLLREAIEADPLGRCKDAEAEIRFALQRESVGGTLQRMHLSGELPLRVTHNDTKLNNVLLNKNTRKALCVLDLDTVMPGLSVYDFGDSIRFGASTATEDEPDTSKVMLDLHLFWVYTKGFLSAAPSLTQKEIEMLPMGALVMALELGIRFLTDHLNGDLYFGAAYPEHNLVRARTQFALAADMERKWDEMQQIVRTVANENS